MFWLPGQGTCDIHCDSRVMRGRAQSGSSYHISSQKQERYSCSVLFLHLCFPGSAAQKIISLIIKLGIMASISVVRIVPHRYAQSPVFQMLLESIKLAINISWHTPRQAHSSDLEGLSAIEDFRKCETQLPQFDLGPT